MAARGLLRARFDMPTQRTYNMHTKLEWDAGKAEQNLLKHGVDFATAATALEDQFAITSSRSPSTTPMNRRSAS